MQYTRLFLHHTMAEIRPKISFTLKMDAAGTSEKLVTRRWNFYPEAGEGRFFIALVTMHGNCTLS
jgi:hypothetical protein